MVGGIGSSASNYINILTQPQSSDNYAHLNNSSLYIADDNAIYVGISQDAIDRLNTESQSNKFLLDYSDPNILEGTGCETIEQLQYINSRGMGATNIDEYRNYIKNFHFLPLLGDLNQAGANVAANMDSILKDSDINDLIEIDKKLSSCNSAEEKLNAFSEIFGNLSKNDNLSPKLRDDLSNLSDLFKELAEKMAKIDKDGAISFSEDLFIKLLDDESIQQKYLNFNNEDKFKASLIGKYLR